MTNINAQAQAQLNAQVMENEKDCYLLRQVVTATVAGSNKRQEVGHFQVIVPSVERFIAEVAGAKVTGHDDDGLPVFDNDAANYLQGAITAASKMEARNKLAPRSAEPKPGLEIPVTFNKLVEPNLNTGGSGALAAIAELVKGFVSWMEETGKPAALHATFGQLLRQHNLISMQSAKVKAAFAAWLEEFAVAAAKAGALTDYQQAYALKAIEACTEQEQNLDDLLAGF